MKKIISISVILFLFLADITSAKELKVLTIGNSFTWSLGSHFKKVVKSVDGCNLDLKFANFSGCDLARHWQYISEEENSGKKIYDKGRTSLKEILLKTKWDVVTIQQASHLSWSSKTYFPYAQNIVDYIRKYCPTAKIMLQQTWSYRIDSQRFADWHLTQKEMFELLKNAYNEAAKKLSIGQIPTGDAVEMARKEIKQKYVAPSREELKTYNYPDTPRQSGDVVGKYYWEKKNGKMILCTDSIHLNDYGEYLQACVWFVALYDKPASEIKYIPKNMSYEQANSFHKIVDKLLGTKLSN